MGFFKAIGSFYFYSVLVAFIAGMITMAHIDQRDGNDTSAYVPSIEMTVNG